MGLQESLKVTLGKCKIETLIRDLRSPNPSVIARSAHELGKRGDPSTLSVLQETTSLKDYLLTSHLITRMEILRAIAKIGCAVAKSEGVGSCSFQKAISLLADELLKPLRWQQIFDPIDALGAVAGCCGKQGEHMVLSHLLRVFPDCPTEHQERILADLKVTFPKNEDVTSVLSFLETFRRRGKEIANANARVSTVL